MSRAVPAAFLLLACSSDPSPPVLSIIDQSPATVVVGVPGPGSLPVSTGDRSPAWPLPAPDTGTVDPPSWDRTPDTVAGADEPPTPAEEGPRSARSLGELWPVLPSPSVGWGGGEDPERVAVGSPAAAARSVAVSDRPSTAAIAAPRPNTPSNASAPAATTRTRPDLRPGDPSRPGAAVSPEWRPQPAARGPGAGQSRRIRAADPAWPVYLRRRVPCDPEDHLRL